MIFGQFQTKKKRRMVIGIDEILHEFECTNKLVGDVWCFTVHSLSCVEFVAVLSSLGYRSSLDSKFHINKRNVHFAEAYVPDRKPKLNVDLSEFIWDILPKHPGLVCVSPIRPIEGDQAKIPLPQRFIDVLACIYEVNCNLVSVLCLSDDTESVWLAVKRRQSYSESRYGFIPRKTGIETGYQGVVQQAACMLGSRVIWRWACTGRFTKGLLRLFLLWKWDGDDGMRAKM